MVTDRSLPILGQEEVAFFGHSQLPTIVQEFHIIHRALVFFTKTLVFVGVDLLTSVQARSAHHDLDEAGDIHTGMLGNVR